MKDTDSQSRTAFPIALERTLDTLEEGRMFSIRKLAEATDVSPTTMKKVLKTLIFIQLRLRNKRIYLTKTSGTSIVQLEPLGLSNLPNELQKHIIRMMYYPAPDEDQKLLVSLLQKKAMKKEKAIVLESSEELTKLVKQGQILESPKGYYLSDEGIIVAKGALKLYPELEV